MKVDWLRRLRATRKFSPRGPPPKVPDVNVHRFNGACIHDEMSEHELRARRSDILNLHTDVSGLQKLVPDAHKNLILSMIGVYMIGMAALLWNVKITDANSSFVSLFELKLRWSFATIIIMPLLSHALYELVHELSHVRAFGWFTPVVMNFANMLLAFPFHWLNVECAGVRPYVRMKRNARMFDFVVWTNFFPVHSIIWPFLRRGLACRRPSVIINNLVCLWAAALYYSVHPRMLLTVYVSLYVGFTIHPIAYRLIYHHPGKWSYSAFYNYFFVATYTREHRDFPNMASCNYKTLRRKASEFYPY